MIPKKLQIGDTVRVISPSRSMAILSKQTIGIANAKFNELGLKVEFSKNSSEIDEFKSSSIKSRLYDLHNAFEDSEPKAIITAIGGFNSNQLLEYIDYSLIKKNPKILCGYSDITAIANAIYAKTGLVTYLGPHYSTFGIKYGNDFTINYFKKCLMNDAPFTLEHSNEWSDDEWYLDQEARNFIKNKGFNVFSEGRVKGKIIGGNLCTFNLLHGTEYIPSLKNSILFIEDDSDTNAVKFDRDLQSILHQPDFDGVKALIIGRFQKGSEINEKTLGKILSTKKELKDIPIITNVDFGHTSPMITFPIGGQAVIKAEKSKSPVIEITAH